MKGGRRRGIFSFPLRGAGERLRRSRNSVSLQMTMRPHRPPTAPGPNDELILVDDRNRAVGTARKQSVHEAGLLHRAFSIFLVDPDGQLLLQQRHPAKYHSGGLWSNSCCGHPRPGERTLRAARRRLAEELGADAPLRLQFLARYCATFANGLTENELVHVYFGVLPDVVEPNPVEVISTARIDLNALRGEIRRSPEKYSYWLKHYLSTHLAAVQSGVQDALRQSGRRARRTARASRRPKHVCTPNG
jgi:isopentenyl-diphosphate Delta-isomerase